MFPAYPRRDGRFWLFDDGTKLPVVSGGEGPDDDDNKPDPKAGTAGDDKTFTQADVDRIVQERLARAPKAPADYDDLKAKAGKFDELEAANATELEKAQKRAEAAEKAAADAVDRARQSDLRSAVIAEATKAGAVDPVAVFSLLKKDAVTVGDDGQVTNADPAVKELLELKPYLVGTASSTTTTTKTGSADGGARGSGGGPGTGKPYTQEDLQSMTPEAVTEAFRKGELNHLLTQSN